MTSRATAPPSLHDLYLARHAIAPHVRRTPLVASDALWRTCGNRVLLKLESLQRTSSFKIRGALWAVARIAERSRQDGAVRVVTASAGNHGVALADAAASAGLPATVFTPADAPRAKRDRIAAFGVDLRAEAADYDDAERRALAFAAEHGGRFVSPYNDPDVVAGAGTIGLEVMEEAPALGTVVVPLGGGGLVSGVATAVKGIAPGTRVVGVEPAVNPAFSTALRAGRIEPIAVQPTIADGLGGNIEPGSMTFELVRQLVDDVVGVTERELTDGILHLLEHEHVVAEGAGAAAVAALLAGKISVPGPNTVVALVTGANIDAAKLAAVLPR